MNENMTETAVTQRKLRGVIADQCEGESGGRFPGSPFLLSCVFYLVNAADFRSRIAVFAA